MEKLLQHYQRELVRLREATRRAVQVFLGGYAPASTTAG